jgi:molybdate transport system permease protein
MSPYLSPAEWSALALSLQVAGIATLMSLPCAIGLGYLLARTSFIGKSLLETIVNLPLVMPPVVTGYFLLLTFGQHGWLGRWLYEALGLRLIFDWKGAALAAAVMAFPLMVRAIRIAMASIDTRLEMAARTLGANRWETFFRITLPLSRRGIVAGMVLAFARSLGEFGATIMIAGNIPGETQTMPLYIYAQLSHPGGLAESYRLVLVSMLLSAAALMIANRLESASTPLPPTRGAT